MAVTGSRPGPTLGWTMPLWLRPAILTAQVITAAGSRPGPRLGWTNVCKDASQPVVQSSTRRCTAAGLCSVSLRVGLAPLRLRCPVAISLGSRGHHQLPGLLTYRSLPPGLWLCSPLPASLLLVQVMLVVMRRFPSAVVAPGPSRCMNDTSVNQHWTCLAHSPSGTVATGTRPGPARGWTTRESL